MWTWLVALAALARAEVADPSCRVRWPAHGGPQITLVTQTSADRLWRVRHLCDRWRGPIALAVGAPDGLGLDRARGEGRRAARACSSSAVRALRAPAEDYPVNALRNAAWAAARTSHVFVLDVDFFPAVETRPALLAALEGHAAKVALVVPAFDLYPKEGTGLRVKKDLKKAFDGLAATEKITDLVPRDRPGLLRCLARGAKQWIKFKRGGEEPIEAKHTYCDLFHGHRSSRYHEWIGLSDPKRPLRIPCVLDGMWEPYVVVPRCGPPRFDERYTGYGKNKLEWIAHLRGRGFEFRTVPQAFCVHAPHAPSNASVAWGAWKGGVNPAKDPNSHKSRVDALYGERLGQLGLYDLSWGYAKKNYNNGVRGVREKLLATPLCAATKQNKEAIGRKTARLAPHATACLAGSCLPAAAHPSAWAWGRVDSRMRNATDLNVCLDAIRNPHKVGYKISRACS